VKIQAGTTYPSRLFFFNPTPPSGAIRTDDQTEVVIENMLAKDPSVAQYLDGSDVDDLTTRRFTYTPFYNEYQNPPTTTLEYGVLYNQYEDGENVIVNEGSVVRGNQITLTFLAGDLSTGQSGALSIETIPTSAPARTVSVTPDGGPITITLPTALSAADWENILSEELQSNGGNIVAINTAPDGVEIQLDSSVSTYEIRMAQIGIGSNPPSPEAKYMISPTGPFTTVKSGDPKDITFEVRDKYNNPVSGEEVRVALGPNAPPGGNLNTNRVTTDQEGRATVRYKSPGGIQTPFSFKVKGSFARDPTGANFDASTNPEDVNVLVTIVGGKSGPAPSIDTFNQLEGECDDTDQGGAGGTTLFGEEAANLTIEWEASMSSGSIEEVTLEMVDTSNNQTADSTRYQPNATSADDKVTLRDERKNNDSCDRNYRVEIRVRSDGGRIEPDSLTSESGSDHPDDPPDPGPTPNPTPNPTPPEP
jgi:hypothetical protein